MEVIRIIHPAPNSIYNDITLDMSEQETGEDSTAPGGIMDSNVWPGLHRWPAYSDLVLIAGYTKRQYAVHRNILMKESAYFEELLQNKSTKIIEPPHFSHVSETIIRSILEVLYSGSLTAPISLQKATDAFWSSAKLSFGGAVLNPLKNHICKCIRDPKRFCDPWKGQADGSEAVYVDDIECLSDCFDTILALEDDLFIDYQEVMFKEIRKRGLVQDLFERMNMESLMNGEGTDEKFKVVAKLLRFYYADDEAIQREAKQN